MQEQNLEKLWKSTLDELEVDLSAGQFNTWAKKTKLEKIENGVATVLCQSSFVKNNVKKSVYKEIQESLTRKLGKPTTLDLVIKNFDDPEGHKRKAEAPLFEIPTIKQQNDQQKPKNLNFSTGLSKKYTFDNFLTGKNNQLAYAVAIAVSDNPGQSYNPVFIHSGVGLGKTHLLQAIGNSIQSKNPSMKVLYTTGESFTNELIEAIQGGKRREKYTTAQFREKFRNVDVLLIDDVQFIIGKDSTQEEFFHTFNTLIMADKQLVLTSDRPISEFNKLPERITSRFSSGMVVDIQEPNIEMRMAILRSKRDEKNDPISNEVLDFVAENMQTNIRELEGAYLQIITKAKDEGTHVTIDLVKEVLGNKIITDSGRPVNINQILKGVCKYYSIKAVDIKGKSRTKDIVLPRQVAMYLMYELTKTPYMMIGDFLGGRDHTTIMHGVKKVGDELQIDDQLKNTLSDIKKVMHEV